MSVKLPEPLLNGTRREVTIDYMLVSAPIERTRDDERSLMTWVLPPWQRSEVWDLPRKRAFVEGIFLGLGTGYYVVHEPDWNRDGSTKPMSGWLIDGQQRISALRDFIHGDLAIFDGVRYHDLDRVQQLRRVRNQVFPYFALPHGSDEKTLRDLYIRLNFGGVAHTQDDLQRVISTQPMPTLSIPDIAGLTPSASKGRKP